MAKIDELSETLGRMVADIGHIRSKADSIDSKVQALSDKSVMTEMTAAAAHKRLDSIEPRVSSHEEFKNRGLGIIAFITFVCGSVGAFLAKIF